MVIVQPRITSEPKIWSVEEPKIFLDNWMEIIENTIAYCQRPDAEAEPGDECIFCKARKTCPELRGDVLSLEHAELDDVGDFGLDGLSMVLQKAPRIRAFLKAIEDEATRQLQAGRTIEGFELVPRLSNRQWNDEEAMKRILSRNSKIKKGDYLIEKLISPAQAEKILPKDYVARYVKRVNNGTKIAPITEGRISVTPALVDFADEIAEAKGEE